MFSVSYWFGAAPDLATLAGRVGIGVVALFVVAGFAARVVAARTRADRHAATLLRRVGRLLTTMGVIGLLLAFMSYENVRFLGDRFWYALWMVGLLAWVLWIAWYALKRLPAMREAERARREKEKYLP